MPELQDDDWLYIVSEYQTHYTIEAIREAVYKYEEDKKNEVTDDTLRMLGYTEEDILKNNPK